MTSLESIATAKRGLDTKRSTPLAAEAQVFRHRISSIPVARTIQYGLEIMFSQQSTVTIGKLISQHCPEVQSMQPTGSIRSNCMEPCSTEPCGVPMNKSRHLPSQLM